MTNIIQLHQNGIKSTRPLEIGIIIQARMTSNRFPGKPMALLLGKPVIQWTIERAKQIRVPKKANKKVILAVPDTMESEPMLVFAEQLGIENSCGSELNVLKRFYDTARFFNLDVIMRITGDCPFIDPVVCNGVLQLLLWRKLDYTSNVYPKRTFQRGLDCECFTRDALDAAYKLSDQLGDFEHVTPWMQRTEEVKKGNYAQKIDMSNVNICVDYPEDIQRIEELFRKDANS
jgi:spore coat polysaccharide biosynthesis protein SpsF (cytidylyltransferase family)